MPKSDDRNGEAARFGRRLRWRLLLACGVIATVFAGMAAQVLRLNNETRVLAATERAFMALEDAAARVEQAAADFMFVQNESDLEARRLNFAALKLSQQMDRMAELVAKLDDNTRARMADEAYFTPFTADGAAHLREFLALAQSPEWRKPAQRPELQDRMRLQNSLYAARAQSAALRFLRARSVIISESLTRTIRIGGGLIATTLIAAAFLVVRPAARDATRHLLALERARREAESASRAKDAFLAAMSHELRTPLNGVLGMAAVLRESELSEKQRQSLDVIRSSGKALLRMISDILEFTQARSAARNHDAAPESLVDLAAAALGKAAPAARDKGLALWLRVDPDLPEQVMCHGREVEDILDRLIDNAVKFTVAGDVGVELTGRPEGGRLQIGLRVCDTGPGVPQQWRARIFDRFTQRDGSETRAHGGGGLGLAIAAQRASSIEARLDCAERPTGGAAFSLRFEAPCADQPARGRLARGQTALLLHPNARARLALAERLSGLGLRVLAPSDIATGAAPPENGVALAILGPGAQRFAAPLKAAGVAVILLGEASAPNGTATVAELPDPPGRDALKAALLKALSEQSQSKADRPQTQAG